MMVFSESRVRQIVRLLGDVAACAGDHTEKKRILMGGLCEMIGVDGWVWTLGVQVEPERPQVFVSFLHEGFSDQRFANYLSALEHRDMGMIASRFAEKLSTAGGQVTMIREDIDPLGLALQGEIGNLWAKADIGPLMLSGFPLADGSLSAVGFYRRVGEEALGEEECQLAHLVLSEVPWLHLQGWPTGGMAEVPKLYPRQRVVLNLLLDGKSRKEIAEQLGISAHTVSGYAKEVYRHFAVSSHVELMKKFLTAG